MSGSWFLSVDKPVGMTSRRVVDYVAELAGTTRAGHAGTLDPLASGVLIVGVEKACRLVEYVHVLPKTYVADVRFGATSSTDDIEGEVVVREIAKAPSLMDVHQHALKQQGQFLQVPPKYSAVKIKGKRAYNLAREDRKFELPPRPVTVHDVQVIDYQFPNVRLMIRCGSGTYIRSIARDLGESLGVGGVLTWLRRTSIGPYTAESAVPIDRLDKDSLLQHCMPLQAGVVGLERITLQDPLSKRFIFGQKVIMKSGPLHADECGVFDDADQFLGVGYFDAESRRLRPTKLGFVTIQD